MTSKTIGLAAHEQGGELTPFQFERRALKDTDVSIDILFCGVCHSDLHLVNNDWKVSTYPLVPGHEIVGRVTATGNDVGHLKVGDLVGVGCMVDSCQHCLSCEKNEEQFCHSGSTLTYNSEDKHLGGMTYGGYSKTVVVDKNFVLKVSEELDPAKAAPLLCAGITTYSPLKKANVGKGSKVGIIGLGGLGHMAVKIAKAMGADVYVLTTSSHKQEAALSLGADKVILSRDEMMMAEYENTLDFILDTVSAKHELEPYLSLLKPGGTLTNVGLPEEPLELSMFPVVLKRLSVSGSLIGGIKETQEMLDFCAKHNITADIELIKAEEINDAYARLQKGDVRYRFVIDMSSL